MSGITLPSQGAGNVPNDLGLTSLTTTQQQVGFSGRAMVPIRTASPADLGAQASPMMRRVSTFRRFMISGAPSAWVERAERHFWNGVEKSVLDALKDAGIKAVVH